MLKARLGPMDSSSLIEASQKIRDRGIFRNVSLPVQIVPTDVFEAHMQRTFPVGSLEYLAPLWKQKAIADSKCIAEGHVPRYPLHGHRRMHKSAHEYDLCQDVFNSFERAGERSRNRAQERTEGLAQQRAS